jgi:hypothetical protein
VAIGLFTQLREEGCYRKFSNSAYLYGMGRPRDDRDVAQDLARELADIAGQLASLKGEANAYLLAPDYDVLRHRLENAHAAVEAAAVEARRRVRLNEGRER